MKKIIFLIFPMILLLLSSCSKDEEEIEIAPAFLLDMECTYFKARMGSTWKYELIQNGVSFITTNTAQSVGEVEDTEVIVLKSTTNGVDQESYLTCDQDKLIQSAAIAQTTGGQTVENLLLTLDLGLPIGEEYLALSLSQDFSTAGISFINNNEYFGKVLERGLTMTAGETEYSEVVKFQLTTFSESIIEGFSQGKVESAITTYYIAPEVGNIYTKFNVQGSDIGETTLLEYNY